MGLNEMSFDNEIFPFKTNTLYCGDNLKILRDFNKTHKESIDLIYIDPPFSSNDIYTAGKKEKEIFNDIWKGKYKHYIEWMKERIYELYDILDNTGSFYLHCDYHVNAHLRILCDELFRPNNFRNEIIWHYKNKVGRPTRKFLSDYDTILFYSKSDDYTFNPQFVEIDNPLTLKRYDKVDKNGKRYKIYHTGGVDRRTYLKPKSMGCIWEINILSANSRERLGYPAQKPESLLELIIKASSNEGNTILDAFGGSGTTLKVAKDLNRNWIGIEYDPENCETIANRMDYPYKNIIGYDYQKTRKDIIGHEYEEYVANVLGGRLNPKRFRGDNGIDLCVYHHEKYGKNIPTQVKSTRINKNHIILLADAIEKDEKKVGFIVGIGGIIKSAIDEIVITKTDKNITIIHFDKKNLDIMSPKGVIEDKKIWDYYKK